MYTCLLLEHRCCDHSESFSNSLNDLLVDTLLASRSFIDGVQNVLYVMSILCVSFCTYLSRILSLGLYYILQGTTVKGKFLFQELVYGMVMCVKGGLL